MAKSFIIILEKLKRPSYSSLKKKLGKQGVCKIEYNCICLAKRDADIFTKNSSVWIYGVKRIN
jgi:hypothetical protein